MPTRVPEEGHPLCPNPRERQQRHGPPAPCAAVVVPDPVQARAAWERIAPGYAAARPHPWPLVVDFLAPLPPGARVLDAGSGGGRHVRAARERGLEVLALDTARGFRPEVQADAAMLPLRDASFDAVLLVAVLGTMPLRRDRVAALREARRVLRPGGQVLVAVWAKWQAAYLRALLGRGTWRRTGPGEVLAPWSHQGEVVQRPYYLYTRRALRRELREAGWGPARIVAAAQGEGRGRDNLVVRLTRG